MPLRRLEPIAIALAAAAIAAALTAIAYEPGPAVAVGAVGVLLAATLALVRPVAAAGVALSLIPLEVLSVSLGGAAALSPAEAMFALTGWTWFLRRVFTGEPVLVPSPLNKPVALLLLGSAAGILIAEDTFTAMKITVMWTSFALVYLMLVAEGTPATIRSLLLVLVAVGGIVAVVALDKLQGRSPELLEQGAIASGRATGSFAHPNVLAAFFVIVLPLAVVFAVSGRLALRPWVAALFVLTLVALAVSLSRGGLLAFAGSLVVLLLWRPARRAAALACGLLLVLSLAGANPLLESKEAQLIVRRIESIQYTGASTGDARTQLWATAPEVFEDHLLLGVGGGNFPTVAPRYGLVSRQGDVYLHAHNAVLTVAAERGLVGLLAIAWGTIALVVVLVRACRVPGTASQAVAFGVTTALVGSALKGIVDYDMSTNVIAALLFLLAGCGVIMSRAAADSASGG